MSTPRCVPVLTLLVMLAGCAAERFDPAAESLKLMQRDAEWSNLATDGKDLARIVSYWTDDAVIMMPGQPLVRGKAAIRSYVARSLATPGFRIHWVSQQPTFSPDGKLAYMQGSDELTVPGPDGKLMTMHLRGISVWRVDPDGQWRCVVDISNEEPQTAMS